MKVSGTQRRELIEKALAAREYSYSPLLTFPGGRGASVQRRKRLYRL